MYLTKNKTFTWMFEFQILRKISQPMSILTIIKAYPFGLVFGLAPSFIDINDNMFIIFLGLLILLFTFRFWEKSFINHHTRLWFYHAIQCYTNQFRRRSNIFAFKLTYELLCIETTLAILVYVSCLRIWYCSSNIISKYSNISEKPESFATLHKAQVLMISRWILLLHN